MIAARKENPMRVPMPSPAGTNRAGMYIDRPRVGAAYDASLPENGVEKMKDDEADNTKIERLSADAAAELYAFLSGKLSDEDLKEFCRMAGVDAGLSMDQKLNRFRMALDGRLGGDMQRLAQSDRYSVAAKIRMFNSAAPASPNFAERFPNVARIKVSY